MRRVKLPALPVEQNNMASAIRVALTTRPAADQVALLSDLRSAPAPNLDESIAAQPVEVRECLSFRYCSRSALRGRGIGSLG
jgi:hypothetical protein